MITNLAQTLNAPQREAVEHDQGPLLILAGAGSGKTRTVTFRIAHLIDQRGVRPESILAVTFTNKAAQEMKERVIDLLAHRGGSPLVCTFHSFAVRVLRRYIDRLGFGRDFAIYDTDDQRSAIKSLLKEQRVDESLLSHRKVQSIISYSKNHSIGPKQYLESAYNREMEMVANAYTAYQESLRRSNALDFDDLILQTSRLLRENADLLEQYNSWYRYLMVDEYQDTNRPQYDLIKLLTTFHDNLCVVGDEDQSIYRFRGADIRNILSFEADFPGTRVIKLEQNYRSTQNILRAAGAVVSRNIQRKGKTLWTDNPDGALLDVYEAQDAQEEAELVAEEAASLLRANPEERIAILYRTNFQSRQFEESLRRRGLSYTIVGGVGFYARAEVKDLIAYLRILLNPQDNVTLARIINAPPRGIGKATLDRLGQLAASAGISLWEALGKSLQEGAFNTRTHTALGRFHALISTLQGKLATSTVATLLQMVADQSGYIEALRAEQTDEAESRALNISELVNAAREADAEGVSLRDFLDHAALISDADALNSRASITLLTMHNAKGLEFPVVFIAGCEEGLFPHTRSNEDPNDLEEERRLCYVAMTRAQRKLSVSYSRMRRSYGTDVPSMVQPSRFIAEIPASLVHLRAQAPPRPPRYDRPRGGFFGARSGPSEHRRSYGASTHDTPDAVRRMLQQKRAAAPGEPEPPGRGSALKPGTRVLHEQYGAGIVIDREKVGDDFKLLVSFSGVGQKRLMERFAKLKRL